MTLGRLCFDMSPVHSAEGIPCCNCWVLRWELQFVVNQRQKEQITVKFCVSISGSLEWGVALQFDAHRRGTLSSPSQWMAPSLAFLLLFADLETCNKSVEVKGAFVFCLMKCHKGRQSYPRRGSFPMYLEKGQKPATVTAGFTGSACLQRRHPLLPLFLYSGSFEYVWTAARILCRPPRHLTAMQKLLK